MARRRAAALAAGLAAWAALAPASDALAIEWTIDRGPEIFRPREHVVATRVGGWIDASYEDNDLDGTTRSINANHVNLFFDTRYRETWQLFLEVEFENESELIGFEDEREYEVEQAYVRRRWGDALEARLGTFNTPFGLWTPIHWSILMDTIRPPLHESLRITPEQQSGLGLTGHAFPGTLLGGEGELRYTAYVGYGNDSDLFDESGSEGWSAGADLRLGLREDRFLGVSYYQQQRLLAHDRTERSYALYGQTVLPGRLLVRGEYVKQLRDADVVPGVTRSVDVAYVKLRWRFHSRAYLNYRFNWGDDDSSGMTLDRRVQTWTLGYQPRPQIKLKLEHADHDFRDPGRDDFRYWGVSIGALF